MLLFVKIVAFCWLFLYYIYNFLLVVEAILCEEFLFVIGVSVEVCRGHPSCEAFSYTPPSHLKSYLSSPLRGHLKSYQSSFALYWCSRSYLHRILWVILSYPINRQSLNILQLWKKVLIILQT